MLAGTIPSTGAPQEQQLQISAAVDVVRLRVAVVHTNSGVIPPLDADDFAVYDNGVRQQVRLLHRPEDTPLRVALLIDSSPSLRPWWRTVQRTAITFLSKLGITGCAYVLPFSDGIGPGRWGRYTANDWRTFLARAPRGDGTSLHDALIVALDQLMRADRMAIEASQPEREDGPEAETKPPTEPVTAGGAADAPPIPPPPLTPPTSPTSAAAPEAARPPDAEPPMPSRAQLMSSMAQVLAAIIRVTPPTHVGNCDLRYTPEDPAPGSEVAFPEDESIKAVLLLSDGADTTSIGTAQAAIDAANVANVPVFPVLLGTAGHDPGLEALLGEIARATGGLVTRSASVRSLGGDYDRILSYLRSSYVLVYEPEFPAETAVERSDAPSSWHDVRVQLRRPLLRAIVRPGYYR